LRPQFPKDIAANRQQLVAGDAAKVGGEPSGCRRSRGGLAPDSPAPLAVVALVEMKVAKGLRAMHALPPISFAVLGYYVNRRKEEPTCTHRVRHRRGCRLGNGLAEGRSIGIGSEHWSAARQGLLPVMITGLAQEAAERLGKPDRRPETSSGWGM
jgi:hypothetical protein